MAWLESQNKSIPCGKQINSARLHRRASAVRTPRCADLTLGTDHLCLPDQTLPKTTRRDFSRGGHGAHRGLKTHPITHQSVSNAKTNMVNSPQMTLLCSFKTNIVFLGMGQPCHFRWTSLCDRMVFLRLCVVSALR